jgi:N-acetylmuramoyl-L-alanine amidase
VRKPLLIWLAFVLVLVPSISWAKHAPGRTSFPAGPSAPTGPVKARLLSAGGSTVPGFEVAFEANTGALWTVGSALNENWALGMKAGTSPSIAALAGGGFEVAFEANTGALWTVGSALNENWALGMKPGTSPTIAAFASGGFEVAFQANTGALWTIGVASGASNTDWSLGMMPGTSPTTAATGLLVGKVIAVDPGHNGGNAAAPGVINQLVWNGREWETCDTTGTETDSGYTEAQFNFNVAEYLADDLEAEGATVVLTRNSNTGIGPCVTERAAIGNNAHADVALSIHADGGPPTGRGFAVLEPVADGPNDAVIGASQVLGLDIRAAFGTVTGEPVSSYDGIDGIQPRNDLAGLNLTTVPKVLIECANMRNPTDASLLTTSQWQQSAARALATGITAYLTP